MLSISHYIYAEQVLHYKIIFLSVLKEKQTMKTRQLFCFRSTVLGNTDSFATVCGDFFTPLSVTGNSLGKKKKKKKRKGNFCRLIISLCIYQGLLSVSKELQLQNITQLTDMA